MFRNPFAGFTRSKGFFRARSARQAPADWTDWTWDALQGAMVVGFTPKLAGWFIENGKYPNENHHVQYMGVSIVMGGIPKMDGDRKSHSLEWMMM